MKTGAGNAKQLAQSASAIGAALLGFGLGAKWGLIIQSYAIVLIVVGAIIHIYGMYVTQMQRSTEKAGTAAKLLWLSAWICLIAVVALFIYLTVRK